MNKITRLVIIKHFPLPTTVTYTPPIRMARTLTCPAKCTSVANNRPRHLSLWRFATQYHRLLRYDSQSANKSEINALHNHTDHNNYEQLTPISAIAHLACSHEFIHNLHVFLHIQLLKYSHHHNSACNNSPPAMRCCVDR